MAKVPSNHGKPVTNDVIKQIKELAKANTPTRIIALRLGRTEESIRAIASANGISLKPTNQSPYGTGRR